MLAPASLPLFVYGTLLDPAFVANLLERPFIPELAELLDFELLELPGLPYPVVWTAPGQRVRGRLYRHLSEEDLERFDAYEGVAEGLYQRTTAEIVPAPAERTDVGAHGSAPAEPGPSERAWVYVPTVQTLSRYG